MKPLTFRAMNLVEGLNEEHMDRVVTATEGSRGAWARGDVDVSEVIAPWSLRTAGGATVSIHFLGLLLWQNDDDQGEPTMDDLVRRLQGTLEHVNLWRDKEEAA